MKRGRSTVQTRRARASSRAAGECPVCLNEDFTEAQLKSFFSCSHLICDTCDEQMRVRRQHRCPTCRAPRIGMSEEEAQPPPQPQIPAQVEFWLQNLSELARSRRTDQIFFFAREPPRSIDPAGAEAAEREVGRLYEVDAVGSRAPRAVEPAQDTGSTQAHPNDDEEFPAPQLFVRDAASGQSMSIVEAASRAESLMRDLVGALRNADRVDIGEFRSVRSRHSC